MGQKFLDQITQKLQLTPDQVSQIKQIHQNFITQTSATRQQIKDKMKAMVALWTADSPDPAAIKLLADGIEPMRVEVRNASIDSLVATLNVMTPDQRTKLHTLIQSHPGFGWMLGSSMFGGMGMCSEKGDSSKAGAGGGPGACPLSQ